MSDRPLRFGYLLPTRESVMTGAPQTGPLLALAERAESMGFDSLWIGDSLLARPRHEPLTLLAAVAARTDRVEIGTAVLLPALRNPVQLAQSAATVDQISEGRLILGVGIAADVPNVRNEFAAAGVPFEERTGRMLEGVRLCRALWQREPVTGSGRWPFDSAVAGPAPFRSGGPPLWAASSTDAGLTRVARHFDGWMPIGPDAATLGGQWQTVQERADKYGRDGELTFAVYLTLSIDQDVGRADERLDNYLADYYGVNPALMRHHQATYAGDEARACDWLRSFANVGATHLILRFAGDQDAHLAAAANITHQFRLHT